MEKHGGSEETNRIRRIGRGGKEVQDWLKLEWAMQKQYPGHHYISICLLPGTPITTFYFHSHCNAHLNVRNSHVYLCRANIWERHHDTYMKNRFRANSYEVKTHQYWKRKYLMTELSGIGRNLNVARLGLLIASQIWHRLPQIFSGASCKCVFICIISDSKLQNPTKNTFITENAAICPKTFDVATKTFVQSFKRASVINKTRLLTWSFTV